MTFFLVALVVTGNAAGYLFQTMGMKQGGAIEDFRLGALTRTLWAAFRNRWVALSIPALALSFFAFMGLVSVADLSFAVPATAAGYVMETLLARYILKESVSRRRWAGAALVACGVVLISL